MGKVKMKDLLLSLILLEIFVWITLIEFHISKIEKENKIYHSITHKPKEPKLENKL